MRNTIKVLGFIAIVAVMGLGCSKAGAQSKGGNPLENTTWKFESGNASLTITFGKTDVTMMEITRANVGNTGKGTYTVSGDKGTMTFEDVGVMEFTIRGNSIILSLGEDDVIFTKVQ